MTSESVEIGKFNDKTYEEAKLENEELRQELERLKNKCEYESVVHQENKLLRETISGITKDRENLQRQLSQKDSEIEDLQNKIDQSEKLLEESALKIDEKDKTIVSLKKELKECQDQIGEFETVQQQHIKEKEVCKKALRRKSIKIDLVQRKNFELNECLQMAGKDIDELMLEREKFDEKFVANVKAIEELQGSIKENVRHIKSLQEQNAELEECVKLVEEEMARLEERDHKLREVIKVASDENDRIGRTLKDVIEESDHHKTRYHEMQKEQDKLDRWIRKLLDTKNQQDDALIKANEEIRSLTCARDIQRGCDETVYVGLKHLQHNLKSKIFHFGAFRSSRKTASKLEIVEKLLVHVQRALKIPC